MAFNPLMNFNQGFDAATKRRNETLAKDEEKRLKSQRESFINAKNKGDALRRMLVDQPNVGFAFMKEMQTDEKGIDAQIEDSIVLKHLLEIDPSGVMGMELLQNRKQTLDSGVLGPGRGSFHTDRAINTLQNEGVEKLLSNVNAFLDIPNQLKSKTKPKQFEKQSQFEQLQELKKTGTPEEIAEFRSIIGLDKPVKLSSTAETALNKAQESSFTAGSAVRKMELLAKDISKIDIGGGVGAGWSETFKNILGSQDEVSNLRREFRSIRSSQAVRNLPPGVASDKDIALALSGFPREDAPATEIMSFLNGQAKLAKMEVAFNDFKGDYISTHKGISGFGKAWRKQLKDEDFVTDILTVNNSPAQQQIVKPNQDDQALRWAQANPNDPRATAILKKQGRL